MSSCRRGRCTVPTEQTSKPRTEDLPVLTEIRDQTLAIRLNRPRKYNAFNSDAATSYCTTYPRCGATTANPINWGTVNGITSPRYGRFQVQFDF